MNVDNLSDLKLKVFGFCEKDKYTDLVNYLQGLLESNPHSSFVLAYLGAIYLVINEEDNASITFLNCLFSGEEEELEKISYNLNELGDIFFKKRQVAIALKIYQEVLEFNPNFLQGYLNLGYCLLQSGNFDSCIELWENTLTINPQWSELYLHLAEQWQVIREYPKAIQYYLEALNYHSQDAKIFYNLGLCYSQTHQISLAITYQEKCLQLDNNFILAYGELGYLYLRQGEVNKAIDYLQVLINDQVEIFSSYLQWLQQNNLNHCHQKQITFNQQLINGLFNNSNISLPNIKTDEKLTTAENNLSNQLTKKVNEYYITTQDWAKENNSNGEYYHIYNDNKIDLIPPKTDKNIHPSFYFPNHIPLPPSFVALIEKGYFWLREDEASSAVITPNNYFIGDISPESPALSPNHPHKHPRYHSLLKKSHLPQINHIQGKVIVLAGLLNNIYFHWLFDILPRIHLLEKIALDWHTIDHILVDNRCDFQRETLDIFGIPTDKILPLSFPTHIQADTLIVPSFPSAIAWMPLWSCNYLRTKILGNQTKEEKTYRRIYISRVKSSNRRLINELEIINLLQEYKFEIVNLELLSVKQQAQLLNKAQIVISVHGSGLSNLVFCQPHTKVIEIFSPFYVYPCYWLVSNLMKLDYHYILGEVFGSPSFDQLLYPDSRFEDIYLNPQHLQKILNKFFS